MLKLRKACEHGEFTSHTVFGQYGSTAGQCAGGAVADTYDLIRALQGYAEAWRYDRSASGFPFIEFHFLNEVWDHQEKVR